MVEINLNIMVIIINVSKLNSPIRNQKLKTDLKIKLNAIYKRYT